MGSPRRRLTKHSQQPNNKQHATFHFNTPPSHGLTTSPPPHQPTSSSDDAYAGGSNDEIQNIACEADSGTFTITFEGQTTKNIAFDASAADIEYALEELTILNDVSVVLGGSYACEYGTAPADNDGFNVTFVSVVGITGDMPMMTTYVNDLGGARRADVEQVKQGNAPLGGSFRLTFHGATTIDIGATATALEVQEALELLDTIEVSSGPAQRPHPAPRTPPTNTPIQPTSSVHSPGPPPPPQNGGVDVSDVSSQMGDYNSVNTEKLWAVTFTGSGVGGNVQPMSIAAVDDELTGNSPSLNIYTDLDETSADRRGAYIQSRTGNELGETFTLTLRGHTTDPIEFNAADTTMKTRLEALPNIGTVDVKRSAPSPDMGYTWTVSFLSNPGYFPINSRNLDLLTPNTDYLYGNESTVTVAALEEGTEPLNGYFQLTYSDGTYTKTTDELEKDISAGDLKVR